MQELWIGWCAARDGFDPERGVPFGAFLMRGVKLHINRVIEKHFERTKEFTYALSLNKPMGDEEDTTLESVIPCHIDTQKKLHEKQSVVFAMKKLKPRARAYLRLLAFPPPELFAEVLKIQEKTKFGRTLGFTQARPVRITNDMIFDLLGYSRSVRVEVLAEVRKLGEKLCQR